jgi:hypothetical protein
MTRAADCALIFGIPVSRAEYHDFACNPHGRDLISAQLLSWPEYEREIAGFVTKRRPLWERAGVRVFCGVTSHQLANIFALDRLDAVILFSHWKDRRVEFFDGLIDIDDLVEMISPSFRGVLDLCVCNCELLAQQVRQRRPQIEAIKYLDNPAVYFFWLRVYDIVIATLHSAECPYLDALSATLKSFADTRSHS